MNRRDSNRRVVAIGSMPPEKLAYALARYSRSPDSIEDSIRWVHAHSSEKFWEQFYFAYGHASIADLGHVAVCFENISELAAIRLEDEPLWDGQAKSSRYQNFAASGCFVPDGIRETETEGIYRGVLGSLYNIYTQLREPLKAFLCETAPRPSGMKEREYERAIDARTFDVVRYLLPLAATTNVGQVVSIRTLEKQITRLLSGQLPELRSLGEELKEVCRRAPVELWKELTEPSPVRKGGGSEPVAPTLSRHAAPSPYHAQVYQELLRYTRELLKHSGLDQPSSWGDPRTVDLVEPHDPLDEVVTTLLYRGCHAPYRRILDLVRGWSDKEKRDVLDVGLGRRGTNDELPKEFRSGYAFVFDILMDIGGWRDLHRHRRCQQVQQNFTTIHGYDIPPILEQAGLERDYRGAMEAVINDVDQLRRSSQEAGLYAIPFACKVRCLFKMDFAEAEYMIRLRTGVKGHWSYRRVAWLMKEQIIERHPLLGARIEATHPDVEDYLTR